MSKQVNKSSCQPAGRRARFTSIILTLVQTIALPIFVLSYQLNYAYADSKDGASMQSTEKEVMAVLDKYMAAVNRIDLSGVTDTYHFPHYRFVNEKVEIWHTPLEAMPMLVLPVEQQKQAMVDALGPNWDRTEWRYRRLLSLGASKAHIDTALVRIDTEGKVIKVFESLYILTKENNQWAIKGRSSFAPR